MIKNINIGPYLQDKYLATLHEIDIGNGTECELFNSLGNEFLSIAEHYQYFKVNHALMLEFIWWGFFFKERAKVNPRREYTFKILQPATISFH
jgi:hypothetical protein